MDHSQHHCINTSNLSREATWWAPSNGTSLNSWLTKMANRFRDSYRSLHRLPSRSILTNFWHKFVIKHKTQYFNISKSLPNKNKHNHSKKNRLSFSKNLIEIFIWIDKLNSPKIFRWKYPKFLHHIHWVFQKKKIKCIFYLIQKNRSNRVRMSFNWESR